MSAHHLRLEARACQDLAEALREAGEDDAGVQCGLASESNLEEMARAVVLDLAQAEAHAAALKETQAALRARAERKLARGQRLRAALLAALETVGLRKMVLPEATVSVGRGQPNILVTDEALVPAKYRKADPRVEAAYEQLLRAAAYAAGNGNGELHADFLHTADALLAHFAIDRRAIAAALKDGCAVAGVQLSNGASWLTVRVG